MGDRWWVFPTWGKLSWRGSYRLFQRIRGTLVPIPCHPEDLLIHCFLFCLSCNESKKACLVIWPATVLHNPSNYRLGQTILERRQSLIILVDGLLYVSTFGRRTHSSPCNFRAIKRLPANEGRWKVKDLVVIVFDYSLVRDPPTNGIHIQHICRFPWNFQAQFQTVGRYAIN